MIDINELRRLVQAATPGPDGVSLNWVKLLQDFQKEANPATVSELLDRLEAAESDALEQARLNGMGASREAALMAKLELAEKERTIDEQRIADLMAELNRVGQENEELRAKVEAMEKQEPVAQVRVHQAGGNAGLAWSVAPLNDFDSLPLMRDGDRLYALPGAQPAQKAVAYLDLGVGGYMDLGTDLTDEQLASLPKGRHMLGIVGTYGVDGYVSAPPAPSISPAALRPVIQWLRNGCDPARAAYELEMLAATPEAKP